MINALIIQHMPDEDGGLLTAILMKHGITTHAVDLSANQAFPNANEFDLMLVMGGPQQVWETDQYPWLKSEFAFIRQWVRDLRKPYFGVCLGHQLLATALDGEVSRSQDYEFGFPGVKPHATAASDPLFSTLPNTGHWLQWHEAEVITLPSSAQLMASSDVCNVQAMSIGLHAVSLQFHAEATPALIENWTTGAETVAAMVTLDGNDANLRLNQQSATHLTQAQLDTEMLFTKWLLLNKLLG
jgi:GMP synthase-like glutamine amidotransferase